MDELTIKAPNEESTTPPQDATTVPLRDPIMSEPEQLNPSDINQEEATDTIVGVETEGTSKQRFKLNPHKIICWPPKEAWKAMGQAFGLGGINMNLWRENFFYRVNENEVGFCSRNACLFCLPLCGKKRKEPDQNLNESEEQDNSDDEEQEDENKGFVSGVKEGLEYYHYLSKLEMRLPRYTGVKKTNYRPDYILSEIKAKEKKLEDKTEEQRKDALMDLEREFAPKHHHKPWFIIGISIIQLIALIILLISGGITLTGVEPNIEIVKDVSTFRGIEDIDIWNRPNIWLGPPLGTLIQFGAIYAPCMRQDEVVNVILLSQPHVFKGKLGCCVVEKHALAGTTTYEECGNLTMGGGKWYEQVCSKMKPNVPVILKPCCFGYMGTCKMTTKEGCDILIGHYFAENKDHCSEIFCFPHFCGSYGIESDEEWHFMPASLNQGWRYVTSVFFHAGILHYLIVLTVQWCAGRPIEAAVGHIRIAVTFLAGTIGGNMVTCFFDPYLPQVGCGGGVFTLLGISLIECIQALHFRKRKYLFEIIFVILIMLFIVIFGFFPFVNNFAHFGGLIFGIPVALATMPHLCFNWWSCKARLIIFIVSVILLIVFIIIFIVLYFVIEVSRFCENCKYLSCIPYTENVCNVLVELHGTLSHD